MCLTEKEAKEYREYLEKLASVKSAEMFSNGGRDHAVVLYSVLLENACLHARFFVKAACLPSGHTLHSSRHLSML